MDIIDIVLEIPEKLQSLAETLQAWLFEGITIAGYQISFWALLGGVLITTLIVLSIIGALK